MHLDQFEIHIFEIHIQELYKRIEDDMQQRQHRLRNNNMHTAASETAAAAVRAVSSARTAGDNETDNASSNNPALQEAINKLSRSVATQRGRDSAIKLFHKYMEESNTDLVGELQRAEDTEAKGEIALSFANDIDMEAHDCFPIL